MSCVDCKDCIEKDNEIERLKNIIIQLNYTKIPELYEFYKHTKMEYKKRETPTFTLTDEDIINIVNSMTYDWVKKCEDSLSKMIVNVIIQGNWKVNDKSRMICSYKDSSGKIVKFELKSWIKKFDSVIVKNINRVRTEKIDSVDEKMKPIYKEVFDNNKIKIWFNRRICKSIINRLAQE